MSDIADRGIGFFFFLYHILELFGDIYAPIAAPE